MAPGATGEDRAGRPVWIRKLERLGWRLAMKHDFFAAKKMEGRTERVNRFYDMLCPLYDMIFRRLEGFETGGARLVERVVGEGDRVLDLGSGTGILIEHVAPVTPHVVALDLNYAMIRRARDTARRNRWSGAYLQGTATELPLADARFDVVLTAYMMVYLNREESVRCLREIRRVLVPGGRVGILCGQGEASPRNPVREEWVEMLYEAGFTDVAFDDFFEVIRIVEARRPEE